MSSYTYLGPYLRPFILFSYLYKIIKKYSFSISVLCLHFFFLFLILLFRYEIEVRVFSLDVAQHFGSGPVFRIQSTQRHTLVFVCICTFRPQFHLTVGCGTDKDSYTGSILDLTNIKLLCSSNVMGPKPRSKLLPLVVFDLASRVNMRAFPLVHARIDIVTKFDAEKTCPA